MTTSSIMKEWGVRGEICGLGPVTLDTDAYWTIFLIIQYPIWITDILIFFPFQKRCLSQRLARWSVSMMTRMPAPEHPCVCQLCSELQWDLTLWPPSTMTLPRTRGSPTVSMLMLDTRPQLSPGELAELWPEFPELEEVVPTGETWSLVT